MKKIIITEEHLKDLLMGKTVEIDGVQFGVKDIGYDRIIKHLIDLKNF
jgi:hypothetical protein